MGCDVVSIDRLAEVLERRDGFSSRVFTDRELDDARRGGIDPGSPIECSRLAARFAAKEAARKALGDLRLPFHDTEVRTCPDGAPELWIRGERSDLSVSLSHDGGIAMAVVIGPPTIDLIDTEGASHAARR
ncbi:MAG: 4'-phosphopantetheinyl transferase superfamily protein [Nitriliruptorales bacterium]|nr:4'-phosphopantetheinyl transferase superfamily protein [Nitriliruptorales bacterium]